MTEQEEIVYIKAKVKGYYKPTFSRTTGVYEFSLFVPQTVHVYDSRVVAPFDLDELKVGHYHQSVHPIENARVYLDDLQYIEQTLFHFLFVNIKQDEDFHLNGESYRKYTAECYYTLKKTDRVKKLPSQTSWIEKFPRTYFQKVGLGPYYDTLKFGRKFHENKLDPEPTDSAIHTSGWDILRTLCFGILFTWLAWHFIKNPIWPLLVGFIFTRVLLALLSDKYSNFAVKNTLLNYLSWILLFIGGVGLFHYHAGSLYSNLLGIGLGLNLLSRYGIWLRRIGGILTCVFLGLIYYNYKHQGADETKKSDKDKPKNEKNWDYNPTEENDTINVDNDTIGVQYLSHKLSWIDNYKKNFQAVLKVRKDHFHLATIQRDQLSIPQHDFITYYNQIYIQLIEQNKKQLDKVIGEYKVKGKQKKLNRNEFADMVVSSVQSIPYCMVHDDSHEVAEQNDESIREYHQNGGPCLANIKFGLQSPTEFVANFKGDCDTRSVYLYYVLSKLGYECVVLGSTEFGHAVIAITGNYSGDCVTYQGTKYYAWETTNKHFTPGNLSPECKNMRYWDVVLGKMNNN